MGKSPISVEKPTIFLWLSPPLVVKLPPPQADAGVRPAAPGAGQEGQGGGGFDQGFEAAKCGYSLVFFLHDSGEIDRF